MAFRDIFTRQDEFPGFQKTMDTVLREEVPESVRLDAEPSESFSTFLWTAIIPKNPSFRYNLLKFAKSNFNTYYNNYDEHEQKKPTIIISLMQHINHPNKIRMFSH